MRAPRGSLAGLRCRSSGHGASRWPSTWRPASRWWRRCRSALPVIGGWGKWSGYWRWVRYPVDQRRIWIRRTRCRPCRSSHALLPDFLFFRRLDEVATIGQVLALRAGGEIELRALARRFDLPRETLRGWWDRFRARSPTLLAEVMEVAIGLDAAPLDLRQKGEAVVFEALDQTLASRTSAIRRATRR